MAGINIDPKEMEAASKQFQDALKELADAQSFDEYADASKKGHQAVVKLDPEERRAKLQELQNKVEAARKKLFDTQDEFRQRMQSQMEAARQNMAMNRGMPGGVSGFPMPHAGMMGPMAGFGAQMPINPVIPPLDTELIWACPECGNKNVNWKSFKGKGARKRYAKRYNLDEREIKKGVRYCIQCSQRMGRDVRMERIRLVEVMKIREDYLRKKRDGELFVKK